MLLLAAGVIRLVVPGSYLWAVAPRALGIILIPDTPGATEYLFPYSLPLTMGGGVATLALSIRMSKTARRTLLASSAVFALSAIVSQSLLWSGATPGTLAPMLLTGAALAAADLALAAYFERERTLTRLRALAGDDAVGIDSALSAIEARLSAVEQTQTRAQTQLRETAAQDERNRLARDLHDTIKQQLFSINMAAATAQSLAESDPVGSREMVQEVRSLSQQAQVEMKALLTQLRPQPLATVGLVQAIKDQLEALHFRSEVATEYKGEALPDAQVLPLGAQEALFRVVQEALSNIARHARARHAVVELSRDASTLTMQINDDGQGFDAARTVMGMGLTNMRARIVELGGSLNVASSIGGGTRISLSLPLENPQAALAESERHRRLEQWTVTAYINTLSYGFGLLTVLFIAGAIVGYVQSATAGAAAPPAQSQAKDAFLLESLANGQAPLMVVLVALAILFGIPAAAVVSQVLVRVRRARLARLRAADPKWWEGFRHLLNLDDLGFALNTAGLTGWAAWLSRGLVDASAAIVLNVLAVVCVVIALWCAMRIYLSCAALSLHPEQWSTGPWLRSALAQLLLLLAAEIPPLLAGVLIVSQSGASATLYPQSVEELSASLQPALFLTSLLPTLLIGYHIARYGRLGKMPTTLPGVNRWGVLRSDVAMCIIIAATVIGSFVMLLTTDESLYILFSLVVVIVYSAAYGLTRSLAPIGTKAALDTTQS